VRLFNTYYLRVWRELYAGAGLYYARQADIEPTTASNEQTGEHLFDSGAVGGGFGFRFLLHKRSPTNICFDLGWGRQGSFGAYVGLADAF
jgi:hypothetical protein